VNPLSNEIIQGDKGTILELIISDDNKIVDLTGATVTVAIKYKATGITKQATITEPLNGICEITLNPEDIQFQGTYTFQATVTFPNQNQFNSNIARFSVTKKLNFVPVVGGGNINLGDSTINGNIIVNGMEINVYDDTQIRTDINNLKTSQHTHTNKAALDRLNINAQNHLTIDGVELVAGGGTGGSSVSDSPTNGNILINGSEVKVYDDTNLLNQIAGKQPSGNYATQTDLSDGLISKADKSVTDNHENRINSIENSDAIKRLGVNSNGKLTIDGVEVTLDDPTSPIDGGTFTTAYNTNIVDGGEF
jgi:hypothetical protein